MVVVGQTEDVYSHLEVQIYDEFDNHLYVHHDIMLASYPLCLEWLNFDPESDVAGNLVAVGTMSPQIEVWDLDIVDCVEPAFVSVGLFRACSTQRFALALRCVTHVCVCVCS
jgi:periodic tryptophan protein 1